MDRELTVATLNIAGAMRAGSYSENNIRSLAREIKKYNPDFIGLQEVIVVSDGKRNDLKDFKDELGKNQASLYAPALNSFRNSHPKKWTSDIFKDYHSAGHKIHQGLGMLIKEGNDRGKEIILVDPWSKDNKRTERPANIGRIMPIPDTIYSGNRDTEPRCLMMTKVKVGDKNVLLCCTQLSTLKEEDASVGKKKLRKPTQNSIELREKQVNWIVKYIKDYQKETGKIEPIVLLGDFNAEPDSKELNPLNELGLVHAHLGPEDKWISTSGWTKSPEVPHTHKERYNIDQVDRRILIDHVFISGDAFSVKEAHIIEVDDLEKDENSKRLSDHNPVVLKLRF